MVSIKKVFVYRDAVPLLDSVQLLLRLLLCDEIGCSKLILIFFVLEIGFCSSLSKHKDNSCGF